MPLEIEEYGTPDGNSGKEPVRAPYPRWESGAPAYMLEEGNPRYSEPKLWSGFMLDQDIAERLCRQKIHPRAFDFIPQGSRMIVIVDKAPKNAGMIELTEETQSHEQLGAGTIIGVGPFVGQDTYPGPAGNFRCDHPTVMLGKHVTFSFAAGKAQRYSIWDHEYDSVVLVMTPFDIWCVDRQDDHWSAREEFEDAYTLTKQGQEDQAQIAIEKEREEFVKNMTTP